jgi:hypothetical protein
VRRRVHAASRHNRRAVQQAGADAGFLSQAKACAPSASSAMQRSSDYEPVMPAGMFMAMA